MRRFLMRQLGVLCFCIASGFVLMGCGQKGDLFYPETVYPEPVSQKPAHDPKQASDSKTLPAVMDSGSVDAPESKAK